METVWLSRFVADRVYIRVQSVEWEVDSSAFVANFDIFLPNGDCVGSISKSRFAKYKSLETKLSPKQCIRVWKPGWMRLDNLGSEHRTLDEQVTFVSDDCSVSEAFRQALGVAESAWSVAQLALDETSCVHATGEPLRTVLIAIDLENHASDTEALWENVSIQRRKMHAWLLSNAGSKTIRQIVLLTRGANSIGEEDFPVSLPRCCVAGWFRSIRLEIRQWRCEHIDLDRDPKVLGSHLRICIRRFAKLLVRRIHADSYFAGLPSKRSPRPRIVFKRR